jgi:hypothetical protein
MIKPLYENSLHTFDYLLSHGLDTQSDMLILQEEEISMCLSNQISTMILV